MGTAPLSKFHQGLDPFPLQVGEISHASDLLQIRS
jgi:hypothetical protein